MSCAISSTAGAASDYLRDIRGEMDRQRRTEKKGKAAFLPRIKNGAPSGNETGIALRRCL
jgi:hypothetical protein